MKKIIALLLAAFMLASAVFVGCSKKDDGKKNNSTTETAGETADPTNPDSAYSELKKDFGTFGGADFNILVGGNVENDDFKYEEDSDEGVESAEYRRKVKVEEDFGVKIHSVQKVDFPKNYGNGPFTEEAGKSFLAGGGDYDAICGCTYEMATMTTAGYLYPLTSAPGVNLNGSWWDQTVNEDLAIAGVLFYSTGDITIFDDMWNHCILFNKTIATDNGMTVSEFYDNVKNKVWTVDKLGNYAKNIYNDLNGNKTSDWGDRFGIVTWNDSACAMITASGTRIAKLDDDGLMELTMNDERAVNMLDKYLSYAYNGNYAINYQAQQLGGEYADYPDIAKAIFTQDQALFSMTMIYYASTYRDMNSEFGIIPYPTLNEGDDYHTYSTLLVSSAYGIPSLVKNIKMSGAITEALAIIGQELVKPAYYDKLLMYKVSRDDDSQEMLDIIFSSKTCDVGWYYNIGDLYTTYLSMFYEHANSYSRTYNATKIKLNKQINDINGSINELKQLEYFS